MSIARQSTTFFKRLVGKGKCKCSRLPVCYAHALIANTGDFHKARQSYCSSQKKKKFVLSEWLRREACREGCVTFGLTLTLSGSSKLHLVALNIVHQLKMYAH